MAYELPSLALEVLRIKNKKNKEFSYESPGERTLKIDVHLPKLLSNIKWLTFLEHGVYKYIHRVSKNSQFQLVLSHLVYCLLLAVKLWTILFNEHNELSCRKKKHRQH